MHPNVIWIIGDQLRAQALSQDGDPNARTPNLERAEVNGVNFTQNLSGFPLCCPFRGSMLTSRYPHQCVPGHEYPLPPGQPTVADVFNANGYDTAYFGKWHLGGFHETKSVRPFLLLTQPGAAAFVNGSATRTTTANGIAGCMAEAAKTRFTTACPVTKRTPLLIC